MRKKNAKCARTGKEILLEDGFLMGDPSTGEWVFLSVDAPDYPADYHVKLSAIVKSPESFVDWMAQLQEQTWFNPEKFLEFFKKFRKENNLFGGISGG